MTTSFSCRIQLSAYLLAVIILCIPTPAVAISPVIIIPGDGASALEVKFEIPKTKHFYCSKSSHGKWERLWIPSIADFAPGRIDCWAELITLQYDDDGHGVHNATGTEIRAVPGLAGLELKPHFPSSNIYRPLVESLEDVHALTYDFRISPAGNPRYLRSVVRTAVEEAYERTGGTRVTLVSHSLGALFVHYFLTGGVVGVEWIEKYVHAWVPVSPAYGGVVSGLKQIVSGDDAGIPLVSAKALRDEQRSYESSLWLMPDWRIYGDKVLITRGERNYTSHNYTMLAADAGFLSFPTQFERVKDLTKWDDDECTGGDGNGDDCRSVGSNLRDPGVEVFPVYGNGVETPVQYVYGSTFDSAPQTVTGMEGDGTVGLESLQAGNSWKRAREPLVLNGATHTDLFKKKEVIDHIHDIVGVSPTLVRDYLSASV